jgi:hypothetical protein
MSDFLIFSSLCAVGRYLYILADRVNGAESDEGAFSVVLFQSTPSTVLGLVIPYRRLLPADGFSVMLS